MKRCAVIFAALSATGLLALLMLECAVRIFAPQPPATLWLSPDARYGHVGKPDFHQEYPFDGGRFVMDVTTNSLGFRDKEPVAPDPGMKTAVLLGDSFTFGHGVPVESRFGDRLTARCAEASMPVRVLNAGVSGWGMLQSFRWMQDHLDALKPDIVVFTFCENDPYDDAYFLSRGVSFDQVRFPGKLFLRAHSHLFRFAQYQYLLFRVRQREGAGVVKVEEGPPKAAGPNKMDARESIVIPDDLWARTESCLREFAAAFKTHNPNGILLVQTTTPCNPNIRQHLSSLADGATVRYVDLCPAFSSLSPDQRYLPYDGHWSTIAHERSAEALFAELSRIIPPKE
jgi:hypothetical protein